MFKFSKMKFHVLFTMALIINLSCISVQISAMDADTFKQTHDQLIKDGYWAQVAEKQLEEKLMGQAENEIVQQAIQSKQCISKYYELQFYDFILTNFKEYQQYRREMGFTREVDVQKLKQEHADINHKFVALQQTLIGTAFPCHLPLETQNLNNVSSNDMNRQ